MVPTHTRFSISVPYKKKCAVYYKSSSTERYLPQAREKLFALMQQKQHFIIERGHCIDLNIITSGRSHLYEKPKLHLIYASSVYTDEVSIQSTEFFQLMRRLDVGIETHK